MDAALQPVLVCLERLCIEVQFSLTEVRDLSMRYPRGIQGTIKSLVDFFCLAYLEIPVILLLGWTPTSVGGITPLATVLPSSIRYLILTTDRDPPESYKWTREEYLPMLVITLKLSQPPPACRRQRIYNASLSIYTIMVNSIRSTTLHCLS